RSIPQLARDRLAPESGDSGGDPETARGGRPLSRANTAPDWARVHALARGHGAGFFSRSSGLNTPVLALPPVALSNSFSATAPPGAACFRSVLGSPPGRATLMKSGIFA